MSISLGYTEDVCRCGFRVRLPLAPLRGPGFVWNLLTDLLRSRPQVTRSCDQRMHGAMRRDAMHASHKGQGQ